MYIELLWPTKKKDIDHGGPLVTGTQEDTVKYNTQLSLKNKASRICGDDDKDDTREGE